MFIAAEMTSCIILLYEQNTLFYLHGAGNIGAMNFQIIRLWNQPNDNCVAVNLIFVLQSQEFLK